MTFSHERNHRVVSICLKCKYNDVAFPFIFSACPLVSILCCDQLASRNSNVLACRQTEQQNVPVNCNKAKECVASQKKKDVITGVTTWAHEFCTSSHGHAWTLQPKLWSFEKFAIKQTWPTKKCRPLTCARALTRSHSWKSSKRARALECVAIV